MRLLAGLVCLTVLTCVRCLSWETHAGLVDCECFKVSVVCEIEAVCARCRAHYRLYICCLGIGCRDKLIQALQRRGYTACLCHIEVSPTGEAKTLSAVRWAKLAAIVDDLNNSTVVVMRIILCQRNDLGLCAVALLASCQLKCLWLCWAVYLLCQFTVPLVL
jgi:hypothetical protein